MGTGAASVRRVLGGGENATPNSGREFDNGKEARRIEIIFTRLVDDAKLTELLRFPIRNNLIQLPALERGLVAPVPQAQNELPRACRHISQDNA